MFSFTGNLLPFLMHGSELFADAEGVFNAVAHGEGGLDKVKATLEALTHLMGHANAAVAAIEHPPAPPVISGGDVVAQDEAQDEVQAVAETPDSPPV